LTINNKHRHSVTTNLSYGSLCKKPTIAPTFHSQHLYFEKLYNLELYRISSNKEEFSKYVEFELKEIDDFLRKNRDLFRYFYSGHTALNKKYFTRRSIMLYLKLFWKNKMVGYITLLHIAIYFYQPIFTAFLPNCTFAF